MELNFILDQAGQAWTRVEAFLIAYPEIAGIGLVVAAVSVAAMAISLLAWSVRLAGATRRSALAAGVRRTNTVGARILVARGRFGRRNAVSRFLRDACEMQLKDFMFGGPFRIIPYPGAVDSETEARKLLERTEADLVLWSAPADGSRAAAWILSRPPNAFEPQRAAVAFAIPKDRTAWNPALSQAMAYAAAKQFRPALGRPQDFRAERLQPVVERLIAILSGEPKADPRLLAEMVDDASAGALQLAASGDRAWLDRAVEIAQNTLSAINRGAAPDRWIAAKINMGRALRLKAEKRFDPVVLRESIAHLTEALDALRAEPRFKLAESAAQAIADAQKLLGARRKFSISGGGI